MLVRVVYKSPSADANEVNEILSAIDEVTDKHVWIMGDFNYPGINWKTLENDAIGNSFLCLVQDEFICQHALNPTGGNNVLDLALTLEEGIVENLQILEHLVNSDHNIIKFELLCKTKLIRKIK